jgi:hypothetical protein
VAISTAAPALDYIVVDTTADAQRAVELLRRRQLGVATFLILEKQAHLAGQMREKVAVPPGGWAGWGLEVEGVWWEGRVGVVFVVESCSL